jgi:hypothetical protein
MPVTVDVGQALAKGFGIQKFPSAVICHRGKPLAKPLLTEAVKSSPTLNGSLSTTLEESVRQLLWSLDPGLSLFPPLARPAEFDVQESAFLPAVGEAGLRYQGAWERRDNRMISMDENSTVDFISLGQRVGLIATAMDSLLPPQIAIRINGGPIFEAQRTEALKFNEGGESYVILKPSPLHIVLKAANALPVTLRGKGLVLYGVRFA